MLENKLIQSTDKKISEEKIPSLIKNLLSRTTKVEGIGKIDLIHQIIRLLLFGLKKAENPEESSARSLTILKATDQIWNGDASTEIKNAVQNLNISIDIKTLQKILMQGAQMEAMSLLKELLNPRIRNYSAPFKYYIPLLIRDIKRWCGHAGIDPNEIGFSKDIEKKYTNLSLAS